MTEALSHHEQQDAEITQPDAQVLQFPSQRQEQSPAEVEHDQADEHDGAELELRRDELPAVPSAAERVPALRRASTTAVRAGRAAKPHAKRAALGGARHGIYLVGGTWDMVTESYKRATHRDIDESIRAAQRDGDHGTAAQLLQHKVQSRKVMVERWQVFGRFLMRAPIGAGVLAATTLSITFVCSVVGLFQQGVDGFTGTWSAFGEALVTGWEWVSWACTTVVPGTAVLGLLGVVLTGYNARRTRRDAPEWAAPQTTATGADEVTVTADRLVTALRNVGIPELKNAIKDGETAGMVDLISQYGPGVRTMITLPRGIPASKLAEKAESLASSLHRGQHEVSIARSPNNESQAELWVARPGALDEPVPASPMMDPDYGPVDLYKDPVPWGLSPQGELIELDLIQRHILIAGLSKQGKTASARALALHAALDPSAELRIADLKGVGDWSMFSGIATTLIEGAGEENELATADMLEKVCAEMERRLAARRAKGAKGDITAAEARDGSGDNHPLIAIIDEVQIAYMSQAAEVDIDDDGNERRGKRVVGGQTNNSRLWLAAKKLHDQGRAVNVHLWQFAQNPTDRNLPAIVREGAHVRGSLYVSNPSIARKALGDAPVDAGAAPHRLRSEIDAGTVVTTGAPEIVKVKGEMANTVRTNFIDTEPAYQVAERAKVLRGGGAQPAAEPEVRDLLADVSEALGTDEKVKATDVISRLRSLAPTYRPYRGLNGGQLADQLWNDHGVKVTRSSVLMVRADRVRLALSAREDDDEGTETA